jgi:choline dehydrogenase
MRWGVYDAFLRPALDRPNLHVIRYAHVTKVNFDVSTMPIRATGVTFLRQGKSITVTASKEVILSAGTINTPQLLMLSGIGPKLHLQQFGVKQKYFKIKQILKILFKILTNCLDRGFG